MVCHSFVPDSFSGIEVYVHRLARMLAGSHEVHVLYRINDPEAPEYSYSFSEYQGISVIRLVNNLSDLDPAMPDYNPGLRRVFAEILDQVKPDLVHVHHLMHLSSDLPQEIAARGIPSIATLHDYWFMCMRIQLYIPEIGRCKGPSVYRCVKCFRPSKKSLLLSQRLPVKVGELLGWRLRNKAHFKAVHKRVRSMREALAGFDGIIANSAHLKNRFEQFGVPSKKITVIRYGLDTERIRASRHEPHKPLRFGFTGTIVEHKGIRLLLHAFRRVPEASLSIWGDYDQNDAIQKYHASLNPPKNVRFMGGYKAEELNDVLSGIDVLFVPSLWEEAYGLTVDEGKLAGIPVIATRVGGIPEHLDHGKDGFLFSPEDADDLVRIIKRFVDDPDLAIRHAPDGNDVISNEEHVKVVEKYYAQICDLK